MTPQDRSEAAECYAEIFQKLLTEGLQHMNIWELSVF